MPLLRHLKQAASPIPREPPVTRATLSINDRPYVSVMSILLVECNLILWIILSRIRFRFLSVRVSDSIRCLLVVSRTKPHSAVKCLDSAGRQSLYDDPLNF